MSRTAIRAQQAKDRAAKDGFAAQAAGSGGAAPAASVPTSAVKMSNSAGGVSASSGAADDDDWADDEDGIALLRPGAVPQPTLGPTPGPLPSAEEFAVTVLVLAGGLAGMSAPSLLSGSGDPTQEELVAVRVCQEAVQLLLGQQCAAVLSPP